MGKVIKYLFITLAGIALLLCAAVLIAPYLLNVEQFKPKIEQIVSEQSGYPLTINGDIDLSVFPWAGLSLTDLKLDNPEGFQEKTFLTVKNVQVRVKVLPLLKKNIEIHRFIIDKPEILLSRDDGGTWNWQSSAAPGEQEPPAGRTETSPTDPATESAPRETSEKGLGIESLLVGECALRNGSITIKDQASGTTRKFSDINLTLENVSLDKPIIITLLARLDDKPVDLKGQVGPLTSKPLAAEIPVDLKVDLFKTLSIRATGQVKDLASAPSYHVALEVTPFNLGELFSQLDLPFPLTADEPSLQPFESIEARGNLSGTSSGFTLSQAEVAFDESRLAGELSANNFSPPDLEFHLQMDSIDIDRYLPAGSEKDSEPVAKTSAPIEPGNIAEKTNETSTTAAAPAGGSSGATAPAATAGSPTGPDFSGLRKITLKGDFSVGKITVHGGRLSDLTAIVNGAGGLFNLVSLKSTLYQGTVETSGSADFRKTTPASAVKLNIAGVQAGPMLEDFTQKKVIEGTLNAAIDLSGSGMTGEQLKTTLSGAGELLFQDGALIGIDLAQLARKIKSGFTLEQQGERPKTDFAELSAPFTVSSGLVETQNATLKSPFIRAKSHGTVDLPSEAIDLRVTPTLVASIKGQGDQEDRSGITVPIIVGGTLKKPTFAPDLKALIQQQGIDKEEINEILKTGTITPERKEQLSEEVEKAKSLLKGLFGN